MYFEPRKGTGISLVPAPPPCLLALWLVSKATAEKRGLDSFRELSIEIPRSGYRLLRLEHLGPENL